MLDDVAKHTLDARLTGPSLFGGPHEIAKIDSPDSKHWQRHLATTKRVHDKRLRNFDARASGRRVPHVVEPGAGASRKPRPRRVDQFEVGPHLRRTGEIGTVPCRPDARQG